MRNIKNKLKELGYTQTGNNILRKENTKITFTIEEHNNYPIMKIENNGMEVSINLQSSRTDIYEDAITIYTEDDINKITAVITFEKEDNA